MSPGQAAAAALLERHGRATTPPTTAVVHEFSPQCTCCDRRVRFVVPAYWNPDVVRLCSACCRVWCEDHPSGEAEGAAA